MREKRASAPPSISLTRVYSSLLSGVNSAVSTLRKHCSSRCSTPSLRAFIKTPRRREFWQSPPARVPLRSPQERAPIGVPLRSTADGAGQEGHAEHCFLGVWHKPRVVHNADPAFHRINVLTCAGKASCVEDHATVGMRQANQNGGEKIVRQASQMVEKVNTNQIHLGRPPT